MDKLRRALWWGLVGLVAAVALAAVIGLGLDGTREDTRRATFDGSPAQLWRAITRFDQTPRWRRDVDEVKIESGEPIRFVEKGPDGPVRMRVQDKTTHERLVLVTDDPGLPFSATWTFELHPIEVGTSLTVTERRTIDNPLVRVGAALLDDPGQGPQRYLEDLGRHLGQEVTPEDPR